MNIVSLLEQHILQQGVNIKSIKILKGKEKSQ